MPLGWHISVYRQVGESTGPCAFEAERGVRLAVWQSNVAGLRWMQNLSTEGKAILLGGDGYPVRFTARAADILPALEGEPPHANRVWLADQGDVLGPQWLGKTTKDEEAMRDCAPDEWLLIEGWDES